MQHVAQISRVTGRFCGCRFVDPPKQQLCSGGGFTSCGRVARSGRRWRRRSRSRRCFWCSRRVRFGRRRWSRRCGFGHRRHFAPVSRPMLDGAMSAAGTHGLPAARRLSLTCVVAGATAVTTTVPVMSLLAVGFAAAIAAATTAEQAGLCFVGRFDQGQTDDGNKSCRAHDDPPLHFNLRDQGKFRTLRD